MVQIYFRDSFYSRDCRMGIPRLPPRMTSEAGESLADQGRKGDSGLLRRKEGRGRNETNGLDGNEGDRTPDPDTASVVRNSLVLLTFLERPLCEVWR
jgi:hypothetical protein